MLNVIDEFTHECLAIRSPASSRPSTSSTSCPISSSCAGHIRSDNRPEFVAKALQEWITAVGAKTAYITPGSPWENGYIESSTHACAMNCSMAKLPHTAGGPNR